jgi:Tfp pilus assembly protein PilO
MPYNYRTELQRYRKYYQSIEPIFKQPSSRAYTAVIFSFLAVSLFGWYAIRPTIQTILYLRREIADKTEINKKMEDKISALIETQAVYQEIEPLIPAVDQALPAQPDAVPLVVQMRNLASRSAVTITTVQLPAVPLLGQDNSQGNKSSKPNISAKPLPVDLTIGILGQYVSIRSFLEGVIAMRRVVAIDGITISPYRLGSESSQSATQHSRLIQLVLKLRTFYVTQ